MDGCILNNSPTFNLLIKMLIFVTVFAFPGSRLTIKGLLCIRYDSYGFQCKIRELIIFCGYVMQLDFTLKQTKILFLLTGIFVIIFNCNYIFLFLNYFFCTCNKIYKDNEISRFFLQVYSKSYV